jgi:hypothetical protein
MPDQPLDVYAAGTQLAGFMCGVCQTPIMAGDEVVFCPADEQPSHAECWEHNGGCPIYGCTSAPHYDEATVQALGSQTGQADFHCPACRKLTKTSLLRCTCCGAPIALESAVSSLEYEDFVFHAKENQRLQPLVWTLLVAAATGVLAPAVLIVMGIIKLHGRLGRFRFNHLLREARTVYYGAFILSLVQVLTLMVMVTVSL